MESKGCLQIAKHNKSEEQKKKESQNQNRTTKVVQQPGVNLKDSLFTLPVICN